MADQETAAAAADRGAVGGIGQLYRVRQRCELSYYYYYGERYAAVTGCGIRWIG